MRYTLHDDHFYRVSRLVANVRDRTSESLGPRDKNGKNFGRKASGSIRLRTNLDPLYHEASLGPFSAGSEGSKCNIRGQKLGNKSSDTPYTEIVLGQREV